MTENTMMQHWIDRLDMLGEGANKDQLKAHLAVCPDPDDEEAQYLRNQIKRMKF